MSLSFVDYEKDLDHLEKLAKEQLDAIVSLIGREGLNRTLAIRRDLCILEPYVTECAQLVVTHASEPHRIMEEIERKFLLSLETIELTEPGNLPYMKYMEVLMDEYTTLKEAIRIEYPEKGYEVTVKFSELDNIYCRIKEIQDQCDLIHVWSHLSDHYYSL